MPAASLLYLKMSLKWVLAVKYMCRMPYTLYTHLCRKAGIKIGKRAVTMSLRIWFETKKQISVVSSIDGTKIHLEKLYRNEDIILAAF